MSPLRAFQASCWLAFLGTVVLGGHSVTYVVDWQAWLVLGALVVVGLGVVIGVTCGDAHHHGDGHDHAGPSWIETGVHALPLVLFLSVGPTALGSQSLGSQLDPTAFAAPVTDRSAVVDGYARADLLALRHDPFLAAGRIEVIARLGELSQQTTRKGRAAPPPRPVLFRHVISCCAADGRPIYAWLAAAPPELPLDTWVRVRGSIDARETGGTIPVITADSIEAIPPPTQPYLILPGTLAAPGHVPVTP
jgi:hypothetical protein